MKFYILLFLILIVVLIACKAAIKKTDTKQPSSGNDLEEFPHALYPVSIKGKWGYMNNKFKLIIQPQFDYAEDFNEGMAAVAIKARTTGNQATEAEKYGFIDTSGNIVINYRYDKVYSFSEGHAVVVIGDKYGFVDKTGKEITPLIYEDASDFSEGLAPAKLGGKNGFIDTNGRMIIAPQFGRACWVSTFSEGLAAVYMSDADESLAGYIDKSGKLVIQAKYSSVGVFSEGLALVRPTGTSKFGYINVAGEMVIAPQFELGLSFSEGVAAVKWPEPDGTSTFRIIDKTGRVLADRLSYAFTGIFREGLAGVESFNNLWGFIDKTGKEVIKPQFAGAKLFRNGLSRMETGHLFSGLKTVYIDKTGRVVWRE